MSLLTCTQLELLSNEILLEIFEYLDGYTLCSVFYGMNWRLSNLLRSCPLHIQFDKHKRDKRIWNTLATFMNPAKIYALSLYGVVIHERFLPSISENLVSLYFYHMNRDSIDRILQHLPTVNQIKTLRIHQNLGLARSTDLICDYILCEHGHRLTSLVNCSLKGFHYQNIFPLITVTFPKLRRLSLLNICWTQNFVQFLQENTPNLRSLYFHRKIYVENQLIPSVVKHIQELGVTVRSNLIDLVDILRILPCLKRLRIFWDNTRLSAIADGTQWQEIIKKYLPCLQHFTLDFAVGINEDVAKTFYAGEFWSTRKVVMKLIVNKIQFRYPQVKTIYFGQQWHFKYFGWSEVKAWGDGRNLNLLKSPSTSHIGSRSSSPLTPFRRDASSSPLTLRSGSRSPLSSESQSCSRPTPRLRSRSPSRLRSRRRPRFQPRSRSRLRSPFLRQLRSRSRSRLRSPFLRQLRSRSRSSSRLRRRPRLYPQSRSQPRSHTRPQLRSTSRSRPRPRPRPRPQARPRSRSTSRSRPRLYVRPRSRSTSRSRPRPYVRPRSRPRLYVRPRSRSTSRSRPRPYVRPRSRPRLYVRPRSRSTSRSRPRLYVRPRSRSTSRSRPRPYVRPRSRSTSRSRPRPYVRPRSRSTSRSRPRPRVRTRFHRDYD